MNVLDTEDHSWFLFEHGGDLYLEVNCNLSAIGYSYMIRLNEFERESYRKGGHEFIGELAREIDYSVPVLPDSASVYKDRRVPDQLSDLATDAVKAWKEAKNR